MKSYFKVLTVLVLVAFAVCGATTVFAAEKTNTQAAKTAVNYPANVVVESAKVVGTVEVPSKAGQETSKQVK